MYKSFMTHKISVRRNMKYLAKSLFFFVHSFSVQPDEIEGAVVAEALGRGADAVIVQDLSFGYSFTTSVRRRLIKFK